jgi:hypothetical protein
MDSRSNKTKKVKGRKVQLVRELDPINKYPGPLQATQIVKVWRRFQVTTIAVGLFKLSDGHNQFLVATTTILANCYADAWRIKKVRAWAPFVDTSGSNSDGGVNITPVGVDNTSNFYNDKSIIKIGSNASADKPAYQEITADPRTPMGSWHIANTVNPSGGLFSFALTLNTTLDILFEMIPNWGLAFGGYTIAKVAAVAGTLYATNLTTSSGTVSPVGINSI